MTDQPDGPRTDDAGPEADVATEPTADVVDEPAEPTDAPTGKPVGKPVGKKKAAKNREVTPGNSAKDLAVDPIDRLSKAEKLEARAAKLRAEQARAEAEARKVAAKRRKAAEQPEATEEVDTALGRAAVRPWRIATAVLAAVLVVVLVLGILYVVHLRGQNSDRATQATRATRLDAARTSATQAARTYAVDFGSYDYRHLDADYAKVAAHLTADFAKQYRSTSSALKPTVIQYRGKSTAAVQGVALSTWTASSATALVFLDQTVTTSQSKTPRIDRNRLQMKLVRQHGTWLIQSLQAV